MSTGNRTATALLAGLAIGLFAFFVLSSCTTGGVAISNMYVGQLKEVDNLTNYETKKKVEDTCRALIVSYNSDKTMYEQYVNSEQSEEQSWARAAKIRANKTAYQYNEFILKNKYVWKDNVPSDIQEELPLIE